MRYIEEGRLGLGSTMLPVAEGSGEGELWSFAGVEQALIDVVHLWRRSPGGGVWPFASDGPWHLVQAQAGDYDARGGDGVSSDVPLRPLPLSLAQVAERDDRSEWISRFVAERDRRLVVMVLVIKAAGRTVSWLRLRRRFVASIGSHGLRKRYSRAITCICAGLNSAEIRR